MVFMLDIFLPQFYKECKTQYFQMPYQDSMWQELLKERRAKDSKKLW
jgi:hypothetical protein